MSRTAYNLHLKGYVGGADFDRNAVDNLLAKYAGKQVNVLIDSTGGSLGTGLSISSAFKAHGNVSVHFVGLNASAATIASLGAAHISIDAAAMYLVHKCSMPFFEWGSLNADQFATLIADCEKIKADLDKLDLNVAGLYARKCRKPTADLLALMKVGGWLSAKEALEWGFVDEITDLDDEPAPKLTDSLASAMASAGMPIPNIPIAEVEKDSAFARFLAAIASFFKPQFSNQVSTTMKKTYQFVCAVLGLSAVELVEDKATLTDAQLSAIENHIADLGKKVDDLEKALADRDADISAKAAEIEDLKARLDKKPAADTKAVVEDHKPDVSAPVNDVEAFVQTYNSARQLFNEV
ncbi:MAG: ATP-dependent Clp protease proteolytic subunit [Muribaculaceae bacterium]|nr:ATP-dependent Clp protease proteolytic subunit [Muribaculaceae bacterium]